MDVISDILPSVFFSKAEAAAKDKKQKNSHYKQSSLPKRKAKESQNDLDESSQVSFTSKASTWEQTDRRSTNDRRRQIAKRGRWLESRNTNDRRKTKQAISITI